MKVFALLTRTPTLLLRGEYSDIIDKDTVVRMQASHANLMVTEVQDRGHAPLLNEPDAVAAIQDFLSGLGQGQAQKPALQASHN